MVNFKIDIISDVVCPWCYIGQRRLNRAIHTFRKTHPSGPSSSFSVTWHPFYLDPTAPTVSIPLRERMAQKFGGTERVDVMQKRLAGLGARDGIVFDFTSRIGRTRDAHRLIEVAAGAGAGAGTAAVGSSATNGNSEAQQDENETEKNGQSTLQNRIVTALFKGYFESGADITDTTWLERVGLESGIPPQALQQWKDQDAGGAAVDKAAERNRRFTSGVPQFTINDKFVVEGAQEAEEFMALFAQIAEGEGEGSGTRGPAGEGC